jgi:hypothetical protein
MVIVKNINPVGCCAWAVQRLSAATPESAQIPVTAMDLGKRMDYEQDFPPLAARPYEPAAAALASPRVVYFPQAPHGRRICPRVV